MLTAAEIRARVDRRPYTPFRIVTSSGRAYDVVHPEMILVGRCELTIGRPWSQNPLVYEGQDHLGVLHVTAMVDIGQPAPPSTNGPAPNS